jgi:hypothetical protein
MDRSVRGWEPRRFVEEPKSVGKEIMTSEVKISGQRLQMTRVFDAPR